jgi:uncharacterized protein (TIGR03083 family)
MAGDDSALTEFRYALAESEATDLPGVLGARVATTAFDLRRPGRVVDPPEAITADVALARAVRDLAALLDSLHDEDWERPALRDLDVQGVVGHLIGVEHDFQDGLGRPDGPQARAHHVDHTQPHARAQRGRPPTDTVEEWCTLAARSVDLVTGRDMAEIAALHALVLPLDMLIVARAFELWTHADDIRRAAGRPLSAPDASVVQKMVDLAVQLLPMVVRVPASDGLESSSAPVSVRLVLTGTAGGTFDLTLGADTTAIHAVANGAATPSTRIVADAVTFCRLVANRLAPDAATLARAGDLPLAEAVLLGAATLALD